MRNNSTVNKLVAAALATLSALTAQAQAITQKPQLGLEHPNGRTVILTYTTQQDMNGALNSKYTTANLNIRLDPTLLTVGGTPIQSYDVSNSPITYTNTDGFGGYDLVDQKNPPINRAVTTPTRLTFYKLADPLPNGEVVLPGFSDQFYYMRFFDDQTATALAAPLTSGTKINLVTIVFPQDWACNNCVRIVTDDVAGTPTVGEQPFLGNVSASPVGSSIHAFGPVIVSPLPIELLSFDAIKTGKSQGTLKWVTAQEKKSSHFEVERSIDGKSWTLLTKVVAAGSSTEKKSYSAVDNLPFPGDNYYRIKLVDADGSFKYTETRKLNFDGRFANSVTVLKNPFASATEIKVSADVAQSATYTVTDATGRVVMYGNWDVTAGDSHFMLNLEGFASGTYMLAVKGASIDGQAKLLKVE